MTDKSGIEIPARERLFKYLEKELVGPIQGSQEALPANTAPDDRYIMGVLFPRDLEQDSVLEGVETDESSGEGSNETYDPVTLSGQRMPSSMGLSFFLPSNSPLTVRIRAAIYEKQDESGAWKRCPLASPEMPSETVFVPPSVSRKSDSCLLFDDRLKVHVRWRRKQTGWTVTVSLVNNRTSEGKRYKIEDCLYQVGFSCSGSSGIGVYPEVILTGNDPEEDELRVMYRHAPVFAVGHGCSGDWAEPDPGNPELVAEVSSSVLPSHVVPDMTHDFDDEDFDSDVLDLAKLALEGEEWSSRIPLLQGFVERYGRWIEDQQKVKATLPEVMRPAYERIMGRLQSAAARMSEGVSLLETDRQSRLAFQLANHCMLIQMVRSDRKYAGTRRRKDGEMASPPDSYLDHGSFKWRPFQLGFMLMTLPSVADEFHVHRDTVDLIWFPTGGGKTEAYLTIAAFEMFRRRLLFGNSGAGTVVITRYTLRLLTSQQFLRAARMICAAEYLRRKSTLDLGSESFDIGLWIGPNTPNRFSGQGSAQAWLQDLKDQTEPAGKNPFQLETCPWCGTEMVPHTRSGDEFYGMRAGNSSFEFFCPTSGCEFHEGLPIQVVDEGIYRHPPTFVIGTVDKFARMAWVEEAGRILNPPDRRPPSLVIQDELHLLSGPLGTIMGVYEAAFSELMRLNGARPKILASTATTRNSEEQVKGLFGSPVQVFPPPGTDSRNSYFARVDKSKPGRLYVGVLSPSKRPTTTLIRMSAGLLQGSVESIGSEDEAYDGYHTLVIYHNSLRELGKTITFAHDDIPARIDVIREASRRELEGHGVLELTSNLSASEIPASLNRLERRHDDQDAVSLVACTNMFSVGIDVQRLGLMIMNGQPKTTAEYIQATSRVGRGPHPGLVLTHYSQSKPRDRSHYESFKSYHSSLYRFVEPSSVTPYALPARERALHAALVILMRHHAGLGPNSAAGRFDSGDVSVKQLLERMKQRAADIDPEEALETAAYLDSLVAEWDEQAGRTNPPLRYSGGRQFRNLIKRFGSSGDGWETMNSMRNVDRQCDVAVVGWNSNGGSDV